MGTLFVILLLTVLVVMAIYSVFRQGKNNKKSSCSGDCLGCGKSCKDRKDM